MKIDLSQINYNDDSNVLIKETITLDKTYYEDTEIISLSDVMVIGSISLVGPGTYSLSLNITGEMILPCSITLDDVIYPFNIQIDEILDAQDDKCEDYLKIIENTIDIMPIIWQNIVVEIPMKVVSPNLDNAKLEGDGWKLLTEEEKMKELDPRLQKLRDLLDD